MVQDPSFAIHLAKTDGGECDEEVNKWHIVTWGRTGLLTFSLPSEGLRGP